MDDASAQRSFFGEALAELVRGFEVVEQSIEVSHSGLTLRADLAGVDALGRLWIVVSADGDGERALLDALEWRAFARERARELAGAWNAGEEASEVRVAIVALESDATLARRALAADLELFDVERWSGASGARMRLVARGAAAGERETSAETFLDGLHDAERALASRALLRLERVDEALELVIGRERITWLRGGRELASLGARGGALAGRVGGSRAEAKLRRGEDLERWMERILVSLFDDPGEDELGPLPELREPGALGSREPLLTAEELAAFRD